MDTNEKEILHQLWRVELEILNVIDQFCADHSLRYSPIYGTLLGAVRHKGFIPWDDDIDLMMPREDYEAFLSLWQQDGPKGYVLQNTRNSSDFSQNFTKIRKDHTAFIQDTEERFKHYHKGVFVDIFPADRVTTGTLGKRIKYAACAVNLLYSREHTSGTGGIIGLIERTLLALPKGMHSFCRDRAERLIRRWDGDPAAQWILSCTIISSSRYYPADLFDHMTRIEFCGKQYQCVADPDTVLRMIYGDYMQLPPEEKRVWTHHPLLIDFEHNYEELKS